MTTLGTFDVRVVNAPPGGGESAVKPFTVYPLPTLTGLSPSEAVAGSAAVTVTLTGTNFVSGSVARFGATNLTTTFVLATQLKAIIPTSLLANAGTYSVTVVNPAPVKGTSNPQTFLVRAGAHYHRRRLLAAPNHYPRRQHAPGDPDPAKQGQQYGGRRHRRQREDGQ